MEKIGQRGSRKAATAGFGPGLALDESDDEESHVGRMLHILVRTAVDSAAALD